MAKYIDADCLLEALKEDKKEAFYNDYRDSDFSIGRSHGWEEAFDRCREEIDKLLLAEYKPIIHGRWRRFDKDNSKVACSVCRGITGTSGKFKEIYYCPHCGARMDGEENDCNADCLLEALKEDEKEVCFYEDKPIIHGRWRHFCNDNRKVACSVCGGITGTFGNFKEVYYCPHCGARMDGEENDC